MSQNYNLVKKDVPLSPSMMTFKEYYMSFIGSKDPHLANGWGWFVDIELDSEPVRKIYPSSYYNPSKYVSGPKTIQKYPSIRSMKSMQNFHDSSMIFEMDDDDNKHRTNNCNNVNIIIHMLGLILLVICYFMTCLTM
jgi:hypothetical protein